MLELKAASFYRVTATLLAIGQMVSTGTARSVKENEDGGSKVIFVKNPVVTKALLKDVDELKDNLNILGLRMVLKSAERLEKAISDQEGFAWETVGKLCDEIDNRLSDELSLTKLFVLNIKEQEYFSPHQPLFGSDVAVKFQTELAFEVDEAAKCLALARPTASVFHLMRSMEIGIRAVARCLGIADPVRPAERNWGAILKALKDGIDAKWPIPATRMAGDGALFEEFYASLEAVRNPWRNATMHVEKKYTDDEAEHIFVAVKGFMKKLASRCDENGDPKA